MYIYYKMIQTILIINFDDNTSESERTKIISKIYSDNDKAISGMSATELKKGLDKSKQVKEVLEK